MAATVESVRPSAMGVADQSGRFPEEQCNSANEASAEVIATRPQAKKMAEKSCSNEFSCPGTKNRKSSNSSSLTATGGVVHSNQAGVVNSSQGGGPSNNNRPPSRSSKMCCLCWCCCCRCHCLAAKNQEEEHGKSMDRSKASCGVEPDILPSLEEIRSWGDSFDRLMRSSAGRVVFREFLKCEYSEENILFWLACEDLKKETNHEVIEEKARVIYEDYISILSPKEVSLDSRVREVVNRNMVTPTPNTFDEAQLQIYTLMHRDSYPRFVNSSYYKKMAQLNSGSRKESSA